MWNEPTPWIFSPSIDSLAVIVLTGIAIVLFTTNRAESTSSSANQGASP